MKPSLLILTTLPFLFPSFIHAKTPLSTFVGIWEYRQENSSSLTGFDDAGEKLEIKMQGKQPEVIYHGLERMGEHGLFHSLVEAENLVIQGNKISFVVPERDLFVSPPANLSEAIQRKDTAAGFTRERLTLKGELSGNKIVLRCQAKHGCPDDTMTFQMGPWNETVLSGFKINVVLSTTAAHQVSDAGQQVHIRLSLLGEPTEQSNVVPDETGRIYFGKLERIQEKGGMLDFPEFRLPTDKLQSVINHDPIVNVNVDSTSESKNQLSCIGYFGKLSEIQGKIVDVPCVALHTESPGTTFFPGLTAPEAEKRGMPPGSFNREDADPSRVACLYDIEFVVLRKTVADETGEYILAKRTGSKTHIPCVYRKEAGDFEITPATNEYLLGKFGRYLMTDSGTGPNHRLLHIYDLRKNKRIASLDHEERVWNNEISVGLWRSSDEPVTEANCPIKSECEETDLTPVIEEKIEYTLETDKTTIKKDRRCSCRQ